MKEYALLCEYSDTCHRHFMLHRAINYIIVRFGYFLVFHNINYHSINYKTHQQVTKTLNKVINSSMKHKMSMAYVRIYTQQSIFFHKVSSDYQNDNFEALAAKTNTNSCQACMDFGHFYKCGSCSLKHTISSIFFNHLIEETHSYQHLWKCPENILNIYMGGLLKSVHFLLRCTV